MPSETTNYHDTNALTILQSYTRARCTKIFSRSPNGEIVTASYDYGYLWVPFPVQVADLDMLFNTLSTLSLATTRCAIRGALREGVDVSNGVPRRYVGGNAAFTDVPRQWVAIDVDGYPGSLVAFYAALLAACPLFVGVGHVVQRTSSFGRVPGVLNVRLWYRTNLPATGTFWKGLHRRCLQHINVDPSLFGCVQPHYTAAPIFQDGIADPCAERVTFARDLFDEIDLSAMAEADRLLVNTGSSGEVVTDIPEMGHPQVITNTIARILQQQAHTSGHFHAIGIASELIGIGCPASEAVPVMDEMIIRAHGRTPRVGESAEIWDRQMGLFTHGMLVLSNPPPDRAFAQAEAPPATPAAAAEMAAAQAESVEGEWVTDPHTNASRFQRMFLRGFIHWSSVDYELLPAGYWRALETEDTLALRMSRAMRRRRSAASDAAFALRAVNLQEYLDPPCRRSNNSRLSDILMFPNGYMRLTDVIRGERRLLPHDPDHFATGVLGAEYDPAAGCPVFDRFLSEILPGDESAQTLVLRIMAYLMIPDVSFQKFFMLVGVPGSGKSTLAKVIDAIVGPTNVAAITDMEDLLGDFGLQPLLGKSVIYLPEANVLGAGRNARRVTNLIKLITGGDPLTVNRKHCPQLHVQLPGRIIITCNNAPELGDDSGALSRRLVALNFQRSFEANPDLTLSVRLAAERSGIVNRLLAAIPGLYERSAVGGFHTPDSARDIRENILQDASPLANCIHDCFYPSVAVGSFVLMRDVMDVVHRWCAENHMDRYSAIGVGRALCRMRGVARMQISGVGRGYRGLALTEEGARLHTPAL